VRRALQIQREARGFRPPGGGIGFIGGHGLLSHRFSGKASGGCARVLALSRFFVGGKDGAGVGVEFAYPFSWAYNGEAIGGRASGRVRDFEEEYGYGFV